MNSEEFVQILKAINNLTDEIRDEKKKNEIRWENNEKRWEENERRWKENEKRWEENERRWKENNKLWEEYRKNRKQDKNDIFNIILTFQNSVENMYKENKERIIKIEKMCPNCKIKTV